MPQIGYCTDVTCHKEPTELYECHCCNWLICLKHLLAHVEVSKRDKETQLDTLRSDLTSVSNTLELIMDKKLHEIEYEKQLINQAKTIMNRSTHTIEEIQSICEEINQAIVSNRKEETIVMVEPSLSNTNTCSCSKDRSEMLNSFSSSSNNIHQSTSPAHRVLRRRTNQSEKSTASKNNNRSRKAANDCDINSTNDENINASKDEADSDEEHDQENMKNNKNKYKRCPLTFDGAFGLTEANHSIILCSSDNVVRRNLTGHFLLRHKFKKIHAHRLIDAIKHNRNPRTTKLFTENEDIIDPDHTRAIQCPFSNDMIKSIGYYPPETQKIPCPYESIGYFHLMLHLTNYHNLATPVAQEISKSYKKKLRK